MGDEGTVEVYRAANAQEAHLVSALLEEAGIEARVVGEMLQAWAGELPLGPAISPCVWVSQGQESRARKIISQWEEQRQSDMTESPAGPWKCQRCGEEVEGNFDICWNCQSSRGSAESECATRVAAEWSDTEEAVVASASEEPVLEPSSAEAKPTRIGPLAAIVIFVGWYLGQVGGLLVGHVAGVSMPLTMLYGVGGGAIALILLTQWCLGGSIQEHGRQEFGLVGASLSQTALGGLAGALLALVGFAVEIWILPVPSDTPQDVLTQMANSSSFGFVIWAVIVIALAPPIEEFAFRGVMLHGLRQRWSRLTAAIIVTLVFAVIHLTETTLHYWPALLLVTILGALAVVLRLRSGSLIPPLAAHLAYNVTCVGATL